ncbi:MAG: hypothetical protein TU35_004195 [Thermoproteus sp. AZ2]|jgi:hypothetical protein|uniref:Uncharacterized protein n=1 Tax=Thermoproteus sp. AZ2 TaxID=1609232 RepID=A0ACC6V0F6_9CREN
MVLERLADKIDAVLREAKSIAAELDELIAGLAKAEEDVRRIRQKDLNTTPR